MSGEKEDQEAGASPRIEPQRNPNFCIAPWTHTFVSPQSERRLCCASREQHSFVHQYIDQPGTSGTSYNPVPLKEHWNSEYMRNIRRKILAGERIPECEVCNDKVLNLSTYRDWFTKSLFPHYVERVLESTDASGCTTMEPISFDYRLYNDCNFKCRMCGEQLSSSWEIEKRQHNEWSERNDPWMVPETKARIEKFQRHVVDEEFAEVIRAGRVEEIYWVGGEPLIWESHWKYMQELVESGNASKVFCRYNSNLSVVEWRGVKLFRDLLPHFKGYLICASIDATGKIGEFIRTGLRWEKWLENFKEGIAAGPRGKDCMALDVTLTLPGLFGMKKMLDLALELDVQLITKITFAFDPQVVLSPLSLPRPLLNQVLDDFITYAEPKITPKTRSLLDTFYELKTRPNFAETYPDTYQSAFEMGREYQWRLAKRRGDGENGRLRMEDILAQNPAVLEWWLQGC